VSSAEITVQAGAHAFGDGSHPTTVGMLAVLEAIDPMAFTPRAVCDMGAGSGILSVAVARQFGCPVVAVDIERQAIETLRENARANAVDSLIHPVHSDGFAHPAIQAAAPFDLILMNILAEPLLRLAAPAEALLAPGGVLVLSGMLAWQEPQVSEACHALGLEPAHRLTLKDWVTLVFQKPEGPESQG
jgi:ribosomal protein L11 methyltransferase